MATSARFAWIFALVPLILGGLIIGVIGGGERDRLSTDQLPAGMDSTLAAELAQELPDQSSPTAVIVFSAEGDAQLGEANIGALGALMTELGGDQAILIPAEDGTAALGIVQLEATSASDVSTSVTQLRDDLAADVPDGITAQVTGPAGIEADLAAVFDGANFRLLGATALVVAILLILTYRSPVLWIIPLTVVGIADQVASAVATRALERPMRCSSSRATAMNCAPPNPATKPWRMLFAAPLNRCYAAREPWWSDF